MPVQPVMPGPGAAPSAPKAVLCDIDGCLYDWQAPFDAKAYTWLRQYLARVSPAVPFSLMTGRSVEFVKVLAAVLGLEARPSPHLCELGALILDGVGPGVTIHPLVRAYGSQRLRRERVRIMERLAERLGDVAFEPSRDFTCNVVTVNGEVAAKRRDDIAAVVAELHPDARVLDSGAVVDVALVPLSKSVGLQYLATSYPGWDPAGVLAIGDSENDIDVFPLVGFRAAPANACEAVKAAVDYVSPHPGILGVRDILEKYFGR